MNNPEKNPNNESQNTDKYKEAMDEKTNILKQTTSEENETHPISEDFNSGDPVSGFSDEEDDLDIDPDTDISDQEIEDLENSANRMPNEEDNIYDDDYLEDEDEDGTPLNEGDDPMGEDLDISPDDMDANEFDDNND